MEVVTVANPVFWSYKQSLDGVFVRIQLTLGVTWKYKCGTGSVGTYSYVHC